MNFLNQSAPIYDSAITMLQKKMTELCGSNQTNQCQVQVHKFFCVIQLATFNISI